jgi:CubicO group peptidase (beta-lactamase class C family)
VDESRRLFLGQLGLGAAVVAALDCGFPAAALATPHATPESLGVSSAAVLAFLDAAAASSHEMHSVLVARNGQIAARGWWAPYRAEAPHSLYSLSKSFTSMAVGFAVAEGKLELSDNAVDFFPQQVPAPISESLAALRVEHLLTMTVGQASDATPVVTREQDWVKAFLALPIAFKPGSVFLYNSAATYLLSAIVQKVTGQKIVDYLRPRLFDPLGLPKMRWSECPRGINTGGWGLGATTESLFRFGQFCLQKGQWKGRQLLPAAWIEQATSAKIQQPAAPGQTLEALKQSSDWHQGYGYQFWRCRHDAFRGDGAFGQFCIVLPKLDAVIAITSRTLDLQGLLNLVWDNLLPGLHNAALPADAAAAKRLRAQLEGLALAPPKGASTSPKHARSADYVVEANALGVQRVSIAFEADTCRLGFGIGDRTHVILSGVGHWRDGEAELPGTPPEFTELVGNYVSPPGPAKFAASGAWKDPDTFEMQWRYYETPHFDTVTLRFVGNAVEVHFLNSLTQMAAAVHAETRPVLKGLARS